MPGQRNPYDIINKPPPTMHEAIGLLVMMLTVIIAGLLMYYFRPRPPTTISIVSRGTYAIIIRFPLTPNQRQEQISVTGDGSPRYPREVSQGPADAASANVFSDYTRRPLTAAEWAALDAVRWAWCQHPPRFAAASADAAVYDIALRCGDNFESRAWLVPPDQLPAAFTALIAAVPAPPRTR